MQSPIKQGFGMSGGRKGGKQMLGEAPAMMTTEEI